MPSQLPYAITAALCHHSCIAPSQLRCAWWYAGDVIWMHQDGPSTYETEGLSFDSPPLQTIYTRALTFVKVWETNAEDAIDALAAVPQQPLRSSAPVALAPLHCQRCSRLVRLTQAGVSKAGGAAVFDRVRWQAKAARLPQLIGRGGHADCRFSARCGLAL